MLESDHKARLAQSANWYVSGMAQLVRKRIAHPESWMLS